MHEITVWPGRIEMPIWMTIQFFPTLVEAIKGLKECHRIGDVDQNRNIQLACSCPERIETRIIDRDQFPLVIA